MLPIRPNIRHTDPAKVVDSGTVSRHSIPLNPADDGAVASEAPEPSTTMQHARPITRGALSLARDEHEEAVTEAVGALDARLTIPAVANVERFLAAQMAPRSPHTSPVTVGVLDKFDCPYQPERISYRLVEVGGYELVVLMARAADCAATEAAVHALVASFKAKLERLPDSG